MHPSSFIYEDKVKQLSCSPHVPKFFLDNSQIIITSPAGCFEAFGVPFSDSSCFVHAPGRIPAPWPNLGRPPVCFIFPHLIFTSHHYNQSAYGYHYYPYELQLVMACTGLSVYFLFMRLLIHLSVYT